MPERRWLAPLADLALLVAPVAPAAAFVLAYWAENHRITVLGWLVLAGGLAMALLIGRRALGAGRILGIAIATGLTVVLAYVGVFLVGAAEFCDRDLSAPWVPWVAIAVVYAAAGLFSLRRGWVWALPLAVVLAFLVGFTLVHVLPGTPVNCAISGD